MDQNLDQKGKVGTGKGISEADPVIELRYTILARKISNFSYLFSLLLTVFFATPICFAADTGNSGRPDVKEDWSLWQMRLDDEALELFKSSIRAAEYPLKNHAALDCEIAYTVTHDGRVLDQYVSQSSGDDVFDNIAQSAVVQMSYKPFVEFPLDTQRQFVKRSTIFRSTPSQPAILRTAPGEIYQLGPQVFVLAPKNLPEAGHDPDVFKDKYNERLRSAHCFGRGAGNSAMLLTTSSFMESFGPENQVSLAAWNEWLYHVNSRVNYQAKFPYMETEISVLSCTVSFQISETGEIKAISMLTASPNEHFNSGACDAIQSISGAHLNFPVHSGKKLVKIAVIFQKFPEGAHQIFHGPGDFGTEPKPQIGPKKLRFDE